MRIFLTIVVGISLMTLASGTVGYIFYDPTLGGSLILLAAWGAMAWLTFFIIVETSEQPQKTKKSKKEDRKAEELSNRVKELEKRLIDLQDIVITNDDKLERLNSQSRVELPTPPRTISE